MANGAASAHVLVRSCCVPSCIDVSEHRHPSDSAVATRQKTDLLERPLRHQSERSQTSEMQLTLCDLLDAQKALQKQPRRRSQRAASELGAVLRRTIVVLRDLSV